MLNSLSIAFTEQYVLIVEKNNSINPKNSGQL